MWLATVARAALPPDVRKVCDLPASSRNFWGYAPDSEQWAQPEWSSDIRKVGDLPHIGRQSRTRRNQSAAAEQDATTHGRQDARAPGQLDATRAFSAL